MKIFSTIWAAIHDQTLKLRHVKLLKYKLSNMDVLSENHRLVKCVYVCVCTSQEIKSIL